MSRNVCIGDIALLKTDLTTPNHRPMYNIIGTKSDDKVVARSVKLLLSNSGNKDDKPIPQQPITKMLPLLVVEDVDSRTKGALTFGKESNSLVGSQFFHYGSSYVEYVEDSSYHDLNS